MLVSEDDVDDAILAAVADTVDTWPDDEPLSTEAFVDALCKWHGGSGYSPDDFDVDSYDNPATRKIMREARRLRRES